VCDLVISNTRVGGVDGLDMIHELRERLPTLAILYLANRGRSTVELEAQLPWDVPVLREPFTAEELRTEVRPCCTSPQRFLKNCTARSCFSAAARVLKVPRLRRLPVVGFFFFE
jgi:hypothetical protein